MEKPNAPSPSSLVGPGPLQGWSRGPQMPGSRGCRRDWETWDYQVPGRLQTTSFIILPWLGGCGGGQGAGNGAWFQAEERMVTPAGIPPGASFPPPSPQSPHLVLCNLTAPTTSEPPFSLLPPAFPMPGLAAPDSSIPTPVQLLPPYPRLPITFLFQVPLAAPEDPGLRDPSTPSPAGPQGPHTVGGAGQRGPAPAGGLQRAGPAGACR